MQLRKDMYPSGYFRLLDRALIGALVFLVVLLLGIQIARAHDDQDSVVAPSGASSTPTAAITS